MSNYKCQNCGRLSHCGTEVSTEINAREIGVFEIDICENCRCEKCSEEKDPDNEF